MVALEQRNNGQGYRQTLRQMLMTCASMVFAAAVAPNAHAQTEPAGPEMTGQGSLAEIVVTARRKAENIEKVPTSMTALGADQLAERAIVTESDLQRSVPGLTIRESLSQNQLNYSIRGQTVDAYTSSSPGVLPYVNEVQISTVSANTFFDLDSVQVLKGPQGTLFGRNTTGGAVLYTTAKPADTFSSSLGARFGNYGLHEFQGTVNLPVVSDKLLLRLAGDLIRRDGYVTNLFDGSKLGEDASQSGRLSIVLKPVDGLRNDTVFQYENIGGNNLGGGLYSVNPCGAPGLASATACSYSPTFPGWSAYLAAHPRAYPGGLSAYLQLQKALGPYRVSFDSPSFFHSDDTFVTNTTTYEITPDLLVKNIFGWNRSMSHQGADVDGSPYGIYAYGPGGTMGTRIGVEQWSEEAQVQGKALNQSVNYILGGYFSHGENTFYIPQTVFELFYPPAYIAPTYVYDNLQVSESEAAFAQSTWDLSALTGIAGLSLTTGLRYTWEQIRVTQLSQSLFKGAPALAHSFNDPSWTVGLEYQATPDLLLYATQRGSWRSGGFNANKTPSPGLAATGGSEFLPETAKDVEIGAKFQGRLAGRPLRLNVAAYDQWIDLIQRVQYVLIAGNPTAVTSNVPAAEVQGIEGDTEYVPADWLKVGGSIAFADARYTDSTTLLFGTTTHFGPYADTPKWTGTLFLQVFLPVPEPWGEVSLRADTYTQSKFYYSNLNNTVNPGTGIAGYSTTNFRLDWESIKRSNLSAAFFITNAFDKVYYAGGLALGSVLGLNTNIPGQPRMFGGELKYKF